MFNASTIDLKINSFSTKTENVKLENAILSKFEGRVDTKI